MKLQELKSRVKFVDLNHSLVMKVKNIGLEAVCDDYFVQAYRYERPVLMTASNPMWTFGGGIDGIFKKHFPELIRTKQIIGGDMERRCNIIFAITVDKSLTANRDMVKNAIKFALDNIYEGETLLLSGIGTGIGGMPEEEFITILQEI